jgi:protein kinase A
VQGLQAAHRQAHIYQDQPELPAVPGPSSETLRGGGCTVDWYALGVLIFEMLSSLLPYHQPEANPILYERITRGPAHIRWPGQFNDDARDLIMRLMEGDPLKRYGNMQHSAKDVFAHPWFREVDWEITAPYLPKISGDGDWAVFFVQIR